MKDEGLPASWSLTCRLILPPSSFVLTGVISNKGYEYRAWS